MKYSMRPVLFFALLSIHSLLAQAQVPGVISYQGVLTDTNGVAKPDGNYSFTFQLYSSLTGGSAMWTEAKALALKKGLFATMLGDQTPFPDNVRFDKASWLELQVGTEVLAPRIRLGAVGYAFSALRADTATFAFASVIGSNSVVTASIENGAVTTEKLADGAVTSAKIADGTITTADVAGDFKAPRADTASYAFASVTATNSVGTSALQDASVTTAKLADAAVTDSKLSDGSVTGTKLANNAVTSAKIADGSIVTADAAANFKAPKADTADVALSVLSASPTGTAGGDLTGNFPNPFLADGVVSEVKISDGAVSNTKIRTVDASKVTTGTLNDARLSTNVTKAGNTFNASSSLVQLTSLGKLPALDGSALTNITVNSLAAGTYGNAVTFSNDLNIFAGSFTGDGSRLTGLSAPSIGSGTLDDARLSTNVTKAGNSFNGSSGLVQLTSLGKLPALDGSALTNISASSLAAGTYSNQFIFSNTSNSFSGSFTGNGSGLTNLSASSISGTIPLTSGGTGATTVSVARTNLGAAASGPNSDITSLSGLSTPLSIGQGGTGSATKNFVDLTTGQNIDGSKTITPTTDITGLIVKQTSASLPTSDVFRVQDNIGEINFLSVNSAGVFSWFGTATGSISGNAATATSAISATSATLADSAVKAATASNASQLNGRAESYYTNANNLTTGTVPSDRLSGSYGSITGVGTLSSLSVSGSITSGGMTSTGDVVAQNLETATGQKFKLISGSNTISVNNLTGVAGTDTTINFGHTFSNPPRVILTNTSSSGTNLDQLLLSAKSITETGFTAHLHNIINLLNASGTFKLDWVAIGQ